MSQTGSMGGLRKALFPIRNDELKKFLPMALIMLCILFNYTILRNTKDSLIATAAGAGVEAIPYLKSIFVTTSAILFVMLYSKLTNIFSSERLFYVLVSSFLAFFALFSFVMYPNLDVLHPDLQTIHNLQEQMPRLRFLISVWGVWTYSLFYILSELWGSVMVSLLFWQFANEIVRTDEAKRFYPLFVLIGNLALMLCGQVVVVMSNVRANLPEGVDAWGVTLRYLTVAVVLAGVVAMGLYRWMHANVLNDPRYYDAATPKAAKKDKPKLSVGQSFKYVFTNPYVGLIALLVLSYGASINLVEFIWKKQLALQFAGDPAGYNAFMGRFSFWTGLSTIVIIFLTKGVIARFGWFAGAIVTPTVLGITGLLFFSLVFFRDTFDPIIMGLGFTATYMACVIGAVQNVLTKGFKYALFDPTKEMSYIPLDQELKTKGKAAVDVVGGRLGKSIGGWILMVTMGLLAAKDGMAVAPYISFFIIGIIVIWMLGVSALAKKYNSLVKK